ncbi:hypothetical protein SRHO_G00190010 [Serrasalmus rhombeus]
MCTVVAATPDGWSFPSGEENLTLTGKQLECRVEIRFTGNFSAGTIVARCQACCCINTLQLFWPKQDTQCEPHALHRERDGRYGSDTSMNLHNTEQTA